MKKELPDFSGREETKQDILKSMDLEAVRRAIPRVSEKARAASKAHWDSIAKPLNGLGELETLVTRIAALTGDEKVNIDSRAVLVMCADNGVVAEGVTQSDSSVTAVMAGKIAAHQSSVCQMAKAVRADVEAIDIGMLHRVSGVRDLHVGCGTENMVNAPAMSRGQALQAIFAGIGLVKEYKEKGYRILVTGEMGIGNTTTSSAMASVLLHMPAAEVTGRGAGLSDAGLARKISAIEKAVACNQPDPADALDVLSKLGGFDIAGMAGVFIGGALYQIPVVIDGLISSVAALTAARLVPECRGAMLASHCSAEPVAEAILRELELTAVLHAGMKLGEGTGAVCLLPLLDMALSVYCGSASFRTVGIDPYQPLGGNIR